MLKTIREKLNAFFLALENFGETKFSAFRNTYETIVSFILIVILLAGIFSVIGFLSITNLLILAVVIAILGGGVWLAKNFGDSE